MCLAALYLPGSPGAGLARRLWPRVADVLARADVPPVRAASELAKAGLAEAAWRLESPGALAFGEARAAECLTPAGPRYPRRWLEVLGSGAPPAVWFRGDLPAGPSVSVVGSRHLDPRARCLARAAGVLAMSEGWSLVSGGAVGADSAAALAALAAGGAGRVLEVLPFGLAVSEPRLGAGQVSLSAPDEPFSTGRAMERNALVYAASSWTVVAHARFRQGGTWTGAADALRRRLGGVLVPGGTLGFGEASAALAALGAAEFGSVESLAWLWRVPPPQPQPALFGRSVVREPAPGSAA